jgi:hypothetical protein
VEGGLNVRAREIVATLARASQASAKLGCDAFWVLGDLFDNTKPTPQLVRAVAEALLSGRHKQPAHVLLGNHDLVSSADHDHAAASLAMIGGIKVFSSPTVLMQDGCQIIVVPYQAGVASNWLMTALAEKAVGTITGPRILLSHLGIWDDATPPYLKAARDAIGLGQLRWLMDMHNIDATLAGNWHSYKRWPRSGGGGAQPGRDVTIPGTLTPAGFQEQKPELTGQLIVHDTTTGHQTNHHIPGPRWVTCNSVAEFVPMYLEVGARAKSNDGWSYYVRIRAKRDVLDRALGLATDAEREYPMLHIAVEVADDAHAEVAKATRRMAAQDPEAALKAYAESVEIKEPGTKVGLVRRLLDYKKGAV